MKCPSRAVPSYPHAVYEFAEPMGILRDLDEACAVVREAFGSSLERIDVSLECNWDSPGYHVLLMVTVRSEVADFMDCYRRKSKGWCERLTSFGREHIAFSYDLV
jgi:hypothetical protein